MPTEESSNQSGAATGPGPEPDSGSQAGNGTGEPHWTSDSSAHLSSTSGEQHTLAEADRAGRLLKLADFIVLHTSFPWDTSPSADEAPPDMLTEPLADLVVEQLRQLQLLDLTSQDKLELQQSLYKFYMREARKHGVDDNLQHHNGQWGGPKTQRFKATLEVFLSQYLALIEGAVNELGWTTIGVFAEDDPIIRDASTQPVDYHNGVVRRIRIVATDEQAGKSTYLLQTRPMREQDEAKSVESLIRWQAQSMVYYDITGELPGVNPDWEPVHAAIARGSYVDYLGRTEPLAWHDMSQVAGLAIRYVQLTMQFSDGMSGLSNKGET